MIQQYINYLANIKGYSPNTCKAYEKDLRDFAQWAKETIPGARWSLITRADIDNYISDLVSVGLKPRTTNRRLAAISGIYRYFQREGKGTENPCRYEGRRKEGHQTPNTIPYKELESAYNHSTGVVKAMLGILITTGIRIQELIDITWQDIDFEKCSITIKGKGNKQRIVWTLPEQLDILREVMKTGHPSGQIFTITQRDARKMIFDALKPFSHAPQLSPHAIRHTFATHLAEMGVNCSTLAEILGHQLLETTQQYIDLGQSAAQQAMLNNSLIH